MGYSSQSSRIILRTQSVPGTFQADTGTAGVAIKLRSGALGSTRELMVPDAEMGGSRDISDSYLGAGAWSGDYELYPRMDSLLTLLNATLGTTNSTEDAVAGTNTHTIVGADGNALPLLSIEEQISSGLEVYHYNDAVVNTLHFESDANGYLMATASIIAVKQVAGATPAVAPVWDNGPMTVGSNITVTYGGVDLTPKSFSLDINNNVEDDDFRLGSFYINDLTPKQREVTATFTLRPEDSGLWRQAVYGTQAATQMGGLTTKNELVITMSTYESIPDTDPGVPYSLALTIPKYILQPYSFAPSGSDIIETDVDGQAVRPDNATAIMTAVLVNDQVAVK